jgi:RimJ/RimL family protein N-acetyltransferase
MELLTPRLRLVLQSREQVEQQIAAMPEEVRAQVSPAWLARMRTAPAGDPWMFAFQVQLQDTGAVVGSCSFKGPPAEGVVEIAYGMDAAHTGKGYATEAAQALVNYATTRSEVRVICAHTLTDSPASKRILAKCGFQYVGDVIDPEDGQVARFELSKGKP